MKKRTTIIILLFALTCQVSASTILWDASHGEYGYVPNKWFSALSNHLAGYGFEIDTTYKGFLVDDPAPYDIAVVCVGSSCYSAYTTEEAEKIKDFVVNGGGLLIMGEMDSHNDNIQPVASAFGITLGVSKIGSYPYAIYTSDFAPHPLFDGIDEICFQSVGELSTSSNLEEVAWYEGTDKALVIAGEYGYGRVVALGDINIFSSFVSSGKYYDRADNRKFSVNTFEYLVPEPTPIKVAVDIKPQSCPNPLNVKSKGVLPVAILGSEGFDVGTIDAASIRLSSVAPIRSGYEDVAAPLWDTNDCNCTTDGPDGFLDLTLKFKTQRIVEAVGDVNDGDVLTLELTGVLYDPISFETLIEGADCILIKGWHKVPNKADINKDGVVDMTDFAIISENWLQSSVVED